MNHQTRRKSRHLVIVLLGVALLCLCLYTFFQLTSSPPRRSLSSNDAFATQTDEPSDQIKTNPEEAKIDFFQAIKENNISKVNKYLNSGMTADTTGQHPTDGTAYELATRTRKTQIVKLFIDHGKKPTGNDLAEAIENGDQDLLLLFLNSGDDPNFRFGENKRPLIMEAVYLDEMEMLQDLLTKGANPDLTDASTMTTLMFASDLGKDKAVEILLKHHADPNKWMQPGTSYASEAHDSTISVTEPLTAYDIAKATHPDIAALIQSYGGTSGKK